MHLLQIIGKPSECLCISKSRVLGPAKSLLVSIVPEACHTVKVNKKVDNRIRSTLKYVLPIDFMHRIVSISLSRLGQIHIPIKSDLFSK